MAYFPPWTTTEERRKIIAAEPKPDGRLAYTPDGDVLLVLRGEPPQLIGTDENAALLQEATDPE